MIKFIFRERLFSTAAAVALTGAFVSSALAHESRLANASTGKVQLSVGFHNEPAFFDGTTNGVDIYLYTYDQSCAAVGGSNPGDFVGAPIDVNGSNGDTVSLQTEVLILSKEKAYYPGQSGNPAILARQNISQVSPVQEELGTAGLYNSWFKPSTAAGGPASGNQPNGTNAGKAYGFHVFGKIHAGANSYQCAGTSSPLPIAARDATVDEYFVCGNGTRTPGDGSTCVEIPQVAP
ncbi:hypothetical protein [Methylocapsa acidiphila]|uniref:hypothetical protein n=1 Tax=Methylocapsa acidiphila TaxID=133552 RepID=UPI0003F9F18B|nr:hypothetical protein [Methylocapsa acidiphila]